MWQLGPLTIRASAVVALAAIVIGTRLTARHWARRGGRREDVVDIAIRAGVFTLVGGRVAQVLRHPLHYFGGNASPLRVAFVWDGRIGFWAAMAFGAVGTWAACRRKGIDLADFADAVAPGLVLALGIGSWVNYLDQTSYGRATDMPWAIRIDPAHRPPATADTAFYQPIFLFESACYVGIALLLIWIDQRWRPRHGRLFAIYMACFALAREAVGAFGTDTAGRLAGLGLDDWGAALAFLGAMVYLWWPSGRAIPSGDTEDIGTDEQPVGQVHDEAT